MTRMTREEAIEVIKQDIPCEHDTDLIEALDMAIKSLEQEPCDKAVSSQEVLDQIYLWSKDEFLRTTNSFDYLRKRINSLKPVASQPKMGKWIMDYKSSDSIVKRYYCSECNRLVMYYDDTDNISLIEKYPYCHCGAKMEGVQE